ncbi:hypothetical protein V5F29_13550 [Xanthobacter aminoxidans]|uniref:hypothetical protein n=1 Tax=Xanthobacter aminoxidans TaxID=186280 RepID=UPI00372AE228
MELGRWCAAAFVCAAATVLIEALAPDIPSVRLASTLSFGSLMAALSLIAAGLRRHYRRDSGLRWLGAAALLAVAFTALAGIDLPRGGWAQALTYQLPFAAILAFAAGTALYQAKADGRNRYRMAERPEAARAPSPSAAARASSRLADR